MTSDQRPQRLPRLSSLLLLLFLLLLSLHPAAAQLGGPPPFNPMARHSVSLGLLVDLTGSVQVENLTVIDAMLAIASEAALQPGFFTWQNSSSDNSSTELTVSINWSSRDTLCNPSQSLLDTIDFVLPEYNIVALLGPPCTSSAQSSSTVAEYYSIPQLSFGAEGDLLNSLQQYPFLLRTVGSHASIAGVVISLLQQYGWFYFTVIASRSEFGIDVLSDLSAESQQWGLTMLTSVNFQLDDPDFLIVLDTINRTQTAGGHVFVLASNEVECQTLLTRVYAQGLMTPGNVFIAAGPACIDSSFNGSIPAGQLAPVLPGVFFINASFDLANPAYQALAAEYLQLTNASAGAVASISYENLLLYDSVTAILQGMRLMFEAGVAPLHSNGQVLMSTLLHRVDFLGVTGNVSFSRIDGSRIGNQYSVSQFNASALSAQMATATVTGQVLTYDAVPVPIYLYTTTAAQPYWLGGGDSVPDAYTPPVLSSSSGVSISSDALTAIICIAVVLSFLILLGSCLFLIWRRETGKVMQRLSYALQQTELARQNEAEANKAKSRFLSDAAAAQQPTAVSVTASTQLTLFLSPVLCPSLPAEPTCRMRSARAAQLSSSRAGRQLSTDPGVRCVCSVCRSAPL